MFSITLDNNKNKRDPHAGQTGRQRVSGSEYKHKSLPKSLSVMHAQPPACLALYLLKCLPSTMSLAWLDSSSTCLLYAWMAAARTSCLLSNASALVTSFTQKGTEEKRKTSTRFSTIEEKSLQKQFMERLTAKSSHQNGAVWIWSLVGWCHSMIYFTAVCVRWTVRDSSHWVEWKIGQAG